MVQGKRKKISYKSKKIIENSCDEWIKVENTHQPIIDRAVFFAVQQRMDGRVKSTGKGKPHLFASKVKCLDCGSTMVKVTSGKYSYLRCKLYSVAPDKKMCTSHLTSLDELTESVSNKIKEYLIKYIDVQRVAERLENEKKHDEREIKYREELRKIKKELSEKEYIIKSLYVDKIKGIIDEKQFVELNNEFLEEKRILLERLNIIQKDIELFSDKKINYTEAVNNWLKFTELGHSMVNGLIDRIEIGEKTPEGKKIKIHWLF